MQKTVKFHVQRVHGSPIFLFSRKKIKQKVQATAKSLRLLTLYPLFVLSISILSCAIKNAYSRLMVNHKCHTFTQSVSYDSEN